MDKSTKNKMVKIGKQIRKLRNAKGWTLEDTEEFGWESWRHMQQIETGNKNLTMTTLFKLAKLYNVKPSEILQDSGF